MSCVLIRSAARQVFIAKALTRQLGVTSACRAAVASDPIQKLFIDKIHDYAQKSKSSGGKLVDASPAIEKDLADELEKITRQYGAKGVDFTKFPTFNFVDADLEAVGINVEVKPVTAAAADLHQDGVKDEDEDKLFWEP